MSSKIDKFTTVTDNCVDNNLEGDYLVFDGKISVFIRSGMAEVGMVRCWKEHTTSSMLFTHNLRLNKLYSSYPNKTCAKENIDTNSSVLGFLRH